MVSILTNSAAISALATLRSLNESMAATQGEVSSGRKVDKASDDAAYWSIATTMRSDNKVLSAVGDTLNLSSAMVDVAYSGMTSAIDVLDQIKTKLVAASEPGVDKSKVQKEISQLQDQLQTISQSASFSGQNWLSGNATLASNMSTSLISGFTRASDGSVSLQTTEVDLSRTVLFNSQGGGILETEVSSDPADYTTMYFASTLKSLLETAPGNATTGGSIVGAFTIDQGDSFSFKVTKGSRNYTVAIDRATVNSALGSAKRGEISDAYDMVAVMNKALTRAGLSSSDVTSSATNVRRVGDIFAVTALGAGVSISSVRYSEAVPPPPPADPVKHPTVGVMEMDITGTTADLTDYISQMEVMIQTATDAASRLGALQSRLSMQTKFTQNLMDTLDKGIGTLVDADMNETSTRLKAQQTQQQLGIQALSIANSDAQSILKLFQ